MWYYYKVLNIGARVLAHLRQTRTWSNWRVAAGDGCKPQAAASDWGDVGAVAQAERAGYQSRHMHARRPCAWNLIGNAPSLNSVYLLIQKLTVEQRYAAAYSMTPCCNCAWDDSYPSGK
jgi:hypothetical protein